MNLTTTLTMKDMFRSSIIICLLVVLVAVKPLWAADESDDEWKYNGALYLWMPDIDIEDSNGNDSTISFNEIVKNLDYVFMGHIGGQKDKLGFMVDTIYLKISETEKNDVAPGVVHDKTEIENVIITPVMTYRVMEDDRSTFDILGGMRYLYMDVNLKFNVLSDQGDDGSVYNGVVGFRGNVQLDDNWHIPFYYDIGKGDSELTYQAYLGAGYTFSSFEIQGGYRYLKFKFDDDDDFGSVLNNLVVKGPMIGAKFWF